MRKCGFQRAQICRRRGEKEIASDQEGETRREGEKGSLLLLGSIFHLVKPHNPLGWEQKCKKKPKKKKPCSSKTRVVRSKRAQRCRIAVTTAAQDVLSLHKRRPQSQQHQLCLSFLIGANTVHNEGIRTPPRKLVARLSPGTVYSKSAVFGLPFFLSPPQKV